MTLMNHANPRCNQETRVLELMSKWGTITEALFQKFSRDEGFLYFSVVKSSANLQLAIETRYKEFFAVDSYPFMASQMFRMRSLF